VEKRQFSLGEMNARLPTADGGRYVVALEHGTLEAGVYAPRGRDPQEPHDRDEVYVVMRGSGTFLNGERRAPLASSTVSRTSATTWRCG
jgi:mannose-6-phosphate isomerase-like protein (cupin superfamily)